jgi:hypothetical protein
MREKSETTPAGNTFPEFLKREPITIKSILEIPATLTTIKTSFKD